MSELTAHLIDESGFISPKAFANEFHTTLKEVATFSGLSPDAVVKRQRVRSKSAQKRLGDIMFILNRVLPWCGSPMQAYAWYRSEPLPGFGDLTAEDLVKRGMAQAVLEHLGRIAEGGYA